MSHMNKALLVGTILGTLATTAYAQSVGTALSSVSGITPIVSSLNGPSVMGAAAAAAGGSNSTTTTSTTGTTGG